MFKTAAWVALLAVGLWLAAEPLRRLPHPYEAIAVQPLPEARLAPLWAALGTAAEKFAHVINATPGTYRPLAEPALQRLFAGQIAGAESVAVSPAGRLTLLDRRGYVHHAQQQPDGSYALQADPPPLYLGPGRPLGYHYSGDDVLLVCDSIKGLVEVDLRRSSIRILANSYQGEPIDYVNDLDLSPDHRAVYFSSSTRGVVAYSPLGFYDTMRSFLLNMYSADVSGRVFRYDRESGAVELVMGDLWYANGVAVGPGEEYVLAVETMGLRVLRKWLKGPRQGETDVFIDALPGFPDGISRSADGNFWLCIVAPLSPLLKFLGPPLVRLALAHLSITLDASKYFVKSWGCVLKVSPEGEVLDVLLDPTGRHAATISGVTEHEGRLFLGNLGGDFVSVFDLTR